MIEFKKDVELTIELRETEESEALPEISLFVLDDKGDVLIKEDACSHGKVKIPAKALNASDKILVARKSEGLDQDTLATAQNISRSVLARINESSGILELSRRRWEPWIFQLQTCVDGNVRRCWWWPVVNRFQLERERLFQKSPELIATPKRTLLAEAQAAQIGIIDDLVLSPIFRCKPVCEGLVEVYERTCCTRILIDPPIIEELCEVLKGCIFKIPEDRFVPPVKGPIPRPDPVPFELLDVVNNGTLDPVLLNASADLRALNDLPLPEARDYILERPYLVHLIGHECSEPVLKGAGAIGINGEFSICYPASLYYYNPPYTICRREVAYKVTQYLPSGPRVIYDGVSGGEWFDPGDSVTLDSYDPHALTCDPVTPVPGPGGAYVALARIGGTDSVHLDSPDQSSDYSVASGSPLNTTAGLAFPEANLAAAKGVKKNLNWGSTLPIRLDFSKGMQATNAEFYRISVVRTNSGGAPIESTRQYLEDAITWFYNDPVFEAGVFKVLKKSMPLTHPGDPTYHKIPFDNLIPSDASWRSNQYHGFVNTKEHNGGVGRHLVTVEIYDSGFNRLVPNSAPLIPGDTAEPFSYETWNHVDHTTTVPFGALSHLFWWDNRPLTTFIDDLRMNGSANNAECQFMQKPPNAADANFSTGFRAYHPEHAPGVDFLLNWKLQWKRGLGGAQGTLDSGNESIGYVAPPAVSATATFTHMLDKGLTPPATNIKCTFSLMLFAAAKTWNGSSYVNPNGLRDVASFALDVTELATSP